MKKICLLFSILLFKSTVFAQCQQNEVDEMPTIYSKGSSNPTVEQDKWMTTIFTTIVEPALKSTKGLRGSWEHRGGFEITPEGLTKSLLGSYMFTLGCKNNKLYEKHEQGLVLNFTLNSFQSIYKSDIAQECSHEETRWKKFDDSKTVYIEDVFKGRQVYYLQPASETKDYPNIAFYRKTGDGEYFVLTKPGVPLFIPLTRREALEINKKNITSMMEEHKKAAAMPGLQPETKADYEKRMAKEFADYRSSLPDPEKFINDLIKQLEDMKPGMKKQQQFWIDMYTKQVELITNYLKNTPATELDKPCITGNTAFLSASFGGNSDEVSSIKSNFQNVEDGKYGILVTLNPVYFNKTISKTAPKFMSVELRIQGNSAVALKAYNDFKTNLDLRKLQSLLLK